MKTNKRRNGVLALMLVSAIATNAGPLFAQDDPLLADTDAVLSLNSEQIDIDGKYGKEQVSTEEIIQNAVDDAERKNVNAVAKEVRKYKIPRKDRKKYTEQQATVINQRLGNLFKGQGPATDSVSTQQSGIAKVETVVPAESFGNSGDIKIITSSGLTNIQGENVDFESKFSGNLMVEGMLTPRISFGAGVGYGTMDIKDKAQTNSAYSYNYNYNNYNNYNNYGYGNYPNSYYDTYGNEGRTLNYKNFSVELNSKFFLTVESRIRPYLGVGAAFNRTRLVYEDKGTSYYDYNYGMDYGNEEYISNYVSGSVVGGAEVNFTQNFGLNLELKYSRGLSKGFATESWQTQNVNPDQQRLELLGEAIETSHFVSVNAGLVVSF